MKYLLALIALLFSITSYAQEIKAGTHYKVIEQSVKSETTEIYEFFGYTCPACNAFEPHLESFEESNKQVKVIRVPVIFHESWQPYAQAFYTAESMGIIDQVHKPIFNAIHLQRKNMKSIEDIADFLESDLKIDKAKFLATSKSFAIDSKVRKAHQLAKKLGITNSPSIVVNNKYKTNARMLPKAEQSYENFIKVVKHLITID
jgi:thiol:disulfide interchange protein DsbA